MKIDPLLSDSSSFFSEIHLPASVCRAAFPHVSVLFVMPFCLVCIFGFVDVFFSI